MERECRRGNDRVGRVAILLWASVAVACAGPTTDRSQLVGEPDRAARRVAAKAAVEMLGKPYRPGGASPRGFDCSGLVVYSFARAGVRRLPHKAAALERLARPVELSMLEPGDLLFFRLRRRKTSHVAIYIGDRAFVHAPSSGRSVERIGFDHRWWGPRIARAGRLIP